MPSGNVFYLFTFIVYSPRFSTFVGFSVVILCRVLFMAFAKLPLICKIFSTSSSSANFLKLSHNFHLKKSILHSKLHLCATIGVNSRVTVNVNCKKYFLLLHGFHRQFSSTENNVISMSTANFLNYLKDKRINRCFFVWNEEEKKIVSSHPELKDIEDWLNSEGNTHYKKHEAIFLSIGMRSNCLLGAFLWNVNRGQACGGIRLIPFDSVEHFMNEGLRLSRRLGVKAALAGLWIGGGKGLICEPEERQHIQPEFRQKIFYDYGDFITSLNGCFIAGLDTGVNTFDLYNIHSRTRWVVSGPEDIGGSGNAAVLLARGLLCAMESALNYLGAGNLSGMRVAVQGAGGMGLAVTSGLLDKGVAQVYVTDTSTKSIGDLHDMLISKARGRLKVQRVPIGDNNILSYDCDILAPCAVGHVLTRDSILDIKAKIICGSANALLKDEDDAKLLAERDITYVLEYIPNRMAFVNAVYENYGRLYIDPAIERHFDKEWEYSIYCLTQKTLEMSAEQNITVIEAAYQLANDYCQQKHPLWPDRAKIIIKSLIAGNWHKGLDFWRKRRNFAKADDCS